MNSAPYKPLMWTIRGNVPVDSLKYEHRWTETDDETVFEELWYFSDGTLARNNCHKRMKRLLELTLTDGLMR